MQDYPDDAAGALTSVERSCVKLALLAAAGCIALMAMTVLVLSRIF
jgi:hypothetical protein